jgi:hypothetical protein
MRIRDPGSFLPWIQDPGSFLPWIQDPGWKNSDLVTGKNIPDPQHWSR